jgi:hypothetical protein
LDDWLFITLAAPTYLCLFDFYLRLVRP